MEPSGRHFIMEERPLITLLSSTLFRIPDYFCFQFPHFCHLLRAINTIYSLVKFPLFITGMFSDVHSERKRITLLNFVGRAVRSQLLFDIPTLTQFVFKSGSTRTTAIFFSILCFYHFLLGLLVSFFFCIQSFI